MNVKRKIYGWLPLLILIIPVTVPCFSMAADTVSLSQVIAIALKNNPSLAASRSGVAAAQAGITQASAAYYPQVNASAGYDHIWRNAGSGTTDAADGDSYSAGLSVTQHLFDFGKTAAQLEKSTQDLESTRSDQRAVQNTVVKAVKTSYFEALKKQHLMAVNQEALHVRQQHQAQAQALYKEGMRPKIDMIRSEVEVSQAQLALINARYALRRALSALETLLGGPPVRGAYVLADEAPPPEPLPTLEALIALAHTQRPEPAAVRAQIRATEAGRLAVQKNAWPDLKANGTYGTSGDAFPLDHRWQLGVNVTWPLFTGYRQTGQIAQYDAEVSRLESQVDGRLLSVTEEVTQAFLGAHEAREAIMAAEISLKHARENLALARGRYGAGVSDAIEFSDAQVLYTEARSARVQAVYDHQKAMAELEYAVGGVF